MIFTISADKVEKAKATFIFSQNAATAEGGCISFRLYQDLEDPTLFFLFEERETQDALEAHWENQK
jgi:quinol monooxygenase YgiN